MGHRGKDQKSNRMMKNLVGERDREHAISFCYEKWLKHPVVLFVDIADNWGALFSFHAVLIFYVCIANSGR